MFTAVILAAGKGTRMNSDIPKVLHKINNKTMIQYVIDAVHEADVDKICIIIGYKGEDVKNSMSGNIIFTEQKEQLGTGHAVMQAAGCIDDGDDVIILCGDAPLITPSTIRQMKDTHIKNNNAVTILTAVINEPAAYGRIIRNEDNNVIGIVEKNDATEEQIKVKEINSGIYFFKGSYLKDALKNIINNNSKGEYYLTDTIKFIVDKGLNVGTFTIEDYTETLGVNTQEELERAREIIELRMNN